MIKMEIIAAVLLVFNILVSILLILGFVRSYRTQHSAQQKLFLQGKLPDPLPDGLLHGEVSIKTTWQGKSFDASNSAGINIFNSNGTESRSFPFKTYTGKGIADKNLEVLKIDYNIPGNKWWAHYVLDEVVETAPEEYLGKLHLRFFGLHFALGFFRLSK